MPQINDDVEKKILDMHSEGKSTRHIASELNIGRKVVRNRIQRLLSVSDPETSTTEMKEFDVRGDVATLIGETRNQIRSEDDAIREFNIDTKVWSVVSMKVKSWPFSIRTGNKKDGFKILTQQQYGVTLNLRRIQTLNQQKAFDSLFENMKSYSPSYSSLPKLPKKNDLSQLCVLGLFDVHFGKMCWGKETGKDYDLEIAEVLFENAVNDLLSRNVGRNISRFALPIGNDFYHIDNSKNTTYNGTPQDVDGRYAKIIEVGEMAVIKAIEQLIQTAHVDVIWVPGNHDQTTSYHLARTVWAWFSKCDRVNVNYSPNHRKYYRWENTLLGFTHGNEEKKVSLPAIMAQECKKDWADSTCCEWLCGHEHRSRQWQTQPVDTFDGVTIRTLRSLAGTDSWHHRKGYISGNNNAAEAYYYDAKNGYCGHELVLARNS